ncbi:aminotransferase class V-fold PLP-dependent enzyme, partial [bacterium]|nr:aminotransferase class V-fold PLP-dependent enzyme [bacterium]
HKFPGAQSSPGILLFNEKLVCTDIPFTPNGGTVRFVSKGTCPVYSNNLETRETGGTPNILGIIRAGMGFTIKSHFMDYIYQHELSLTRRFSKELKRMCKRYRNLRCLVPVDNPNRLPIFSIQIKPFHYNYVVVLLSDIFGITTRGGVNCSGIFAEKLLKLKPNETDKIKRSIVHGQGVPNHYGWVRITLTSIHTESDVKKVLKAIEYIVNFGHTYTKQYQYDANKNVFKYKNANLRSGNK